MRSIKKKGKLIDYILPGKNYYPVSKTITTEAGIYHDWLNDIYIILGNEKYNTYLLTYDKKSNKFKFILKTELNAIHNYKFKITYLE